MDMVTNFWLENWMWFTPVLIIGIIAISAIVSWISRDRSPQAWINEADDHNPQPKREGDQVWLRERPRGLKPGALGFPAARWQAATCFIRKVNADGTVHLMVYDGPEGSDILYENVSPLSLSRESLRPPRNQYTPSMNGTAA